MTSKQKGHNSRTVNQFSIGVLSLGTLISAVTIVIAVALGTLRSGSNETIDILALNGAAIAVIFLLMVSSLLCKSWCRARSNTHWMIEWYGELSSEFAGAGIIGLLLLLVVTIPEVANENRQHIETLVNAMRSPVQSVAVPAAQELHSLNILTDFEANYLESHEIDLSYANLEDAILPGSNFRGTRLFVANLHNAILTDSVFDRSWLHNVDFFGATLVGVSFADTTLFNANLENAELHGVGINAIFNTGTQLPDATYWTSDTDMSRFTDSSNPHFWRSQDCWSPAYYDPNTSCAYYREN